MSVLARYALARYALAREILRCAQDDTKKVNALRSG
jgi:hypothetical protein